MELEEWCRGKGDFENQKNGWLCSFENGTEIKKTGQEFVAKVLPEGHHDDTNHIKDVFRSKNPEVVSEDSLMFGAERVTFHKGVLINKD